MNKKNPVLYLAQSQKVTYADIAKALKQLKVKRGGAVFVHADISAFGKMGDVRNRDTFLGFLVKAFKEAVGVDGALIMPTFNHDFCKTGMYDVDNTPSAVGTLSEYFRKQKGVTRTENPIFSAAAWGKGKHFFTSHLSRDCFGRDSLFGRLHKKNAAIIFFGAPFQSCTFSHYVEQMYGAPYRYHKSFSGIISNKKKTTHVTYDYFVRPLDGSVRGDLSRFKKHLIAKKLLFGVKIGLGEILRVNAKDFFNEGVRMIKKDPYIFIKKPT